MLRDYASVISAPLAYIINMSLSSGTIPTKWKIAKVITLYKSDPKSDIGNYRPISILSVLSKVLESLVQQKLINYLEENRLLYDHQFGIRSKWSTELAVTLLVDKIRKEADKGNITGAIYIDLSKAFDTVNHSSLLDKLPCYGIKDFELLWFTDYLFLRKQIVEYDGVYSNTESMSVGVPQGSILGPLVFLILFNDVHKSLMHSQILVYADDTVIFTSHRDINIIEGHLNEDINNLSKWLSENELIMNIKKGKTESTLFATGKRLSKLGTPSLNINVNGNHINFTDSYNYSGIYLDSTLSFNENFDKSYKKA